jgi:hypothetical protein
VLNGIPFNFDVSIVGLRVFRAARKDSGAFNEEANRAVERLARPGTDL